MEKKKSVGNWYVINPVYAGKPFDEWPKDGGPVWLNMNPKKKK